ncbi:uncharacterized protein LOC110263849 [Arachis ipaensis]|uniref:uncharacterized protein LOC110263849 n=1 Tax=Arachis ipaensis TaxID=130454 RepID=UPI000A2B3567|nr:uncharacterized protein LOC110263849 [Arachis ipaensis]
MILIFVLGFLHLLMVRSRTKLTQFKNVKKNSLTINQYLATIKKLIDSLTALGYDVLNETHIEAICDGLLEDYSRCITLIQTKPELFTIGEVETLLISHQETLEKFKQLSIGLAQAQLAQSNLSNPRFAGRTSGGRRGARGGRFARGGRNSWQTTNRLCCQVCNCPGYSTLHCFYRFDQAYNGYSSNSTDAGSFNPPPPPSSSFHQPQCYLTSTSSIADTAWYPDTGASHHLTHNSANLVSSAEYTGPDQLYIANGSGQQANTFSRNS